MDNNTRRKINVEEPEWRHWRARAAEDGVTVSELVISAMNAYVSGTKSKKAAAPEASKPKPDAPVLELVQRGSASPEVTIGAPAEEPRRVAALTPLDDLPDDVGPSFGSSRSAPKPAVAVKAGRSVGRHT